MPVLFPQQRAYVNVIYNGWSRPLPIRGNIAYVASSLIDWYPALPQGNIHHDLMSQKVAFAREMVNIVLGLMFSSTGLV